MLSTQIIVKNVIVFTVYYANLTRSITMDRGKKSYLWQPEITSVMQQKKMEDD